MTALEKALLDYKHAQEMAECNATLLIKDDAKYSDLCIARMNRLDAATKAFESFKSATDNPPAVAAYFTMLAEYERRIHPDCMLSAWGGCEQCREICGRYSDAHEKLMDVKIPF